MPRSQRYPVPALEKGLDILEALAAAAGPQSLAELAARLRRSSSELFRMLNCLERRGYLTREPGSGRFDLSLRLYALAHAHDATAKLLRAARDPMRALTERTGESCHLSVLDRGWLLVIAQEEGPGRVRLSIEVGGRFDPVTTASGRLLLAHLEPAERVRTIAGSPAGRALGTEGRRRMESALTAIRRRGVSAADGETVEGVRDLAVLVGRPERHVTAALTVTRLRRRGERGGEAALLETLRRAAEATSRTLGLIP